mmetsp:Transcript_29083/g.73090  ORF Transcript_29083/g.73090 Transcript_29083/m.73090 type:complete len:209 (+) Transcript_29083:512-1138(+)
MRKPEDVLLDRVPPGLMQVQKNVRRGREHRRAQLLLPRRRGKHERQPGVVDCLGGQRFELRVEEAKLEVGVVFIGGRGGGGEALVEGEGDGEDAEDADDGADDGDGEGEAAGGAARERTTERGGERRVVPLGGAGVHGREEVRKEVHQQGWACSPGPACLFEGCAGVPLVIPISTIICGSGGSPRRRCQAHPSPPILDFFPNPPNPSK